MAGRAARRARPPRARGQHFLASRALAASLVAEAGVEPGDLVLDVGAGRGILTAELLAAGARVVAVEHDPALAAELGARFPAVRVLAGDARRLAPPREPFRVVANLPFAGAGEILRALLDDPRTPLLSAAVVLQWEAAVKRAAVWPSTLASVRWGAWHELRLGRRLARTAFAPPPAVDAGVLVVRRRAEPLVPLAEADRYARLLRRAFAAHAPVRAALPARTVKRLAPALGCDPDCRARDLDARQWAALYRAASGSSPRPSASPSSRRRSR